MTQAGSILATYGSNIPTQNLDADCNALQKAMKGLGTDEQAIINILAQRPNAHRYMLKKRYLELFNKDLVKELKSELSGHFEDIVIALLYSPFELDCNALYEAMHRLGTNEDTLIEIIATRPPYQLEQDKILFPQLYKKDLCEYVKSETSGHFRKILLGILECKRHPENYPINEQELQQEAQALYKAGAARLGTDESVFERIFSTRSAFEMQKISEYYKQVAKVDLLTSIRKEFSGDAKKALEAVFYACTNPAEWFATKIRDAVKGAGTKDKVLIRIIVSRMEVDLKQIKLAYYNLYQRDMTTDIMNDTTRDYKKMLTAILNYW